MKLTEAERQILRNQLDIMAALANVVAATTDGGREYWQDQLTKRCDETRAALAATEEGK